MGNLHDVQTEKAAVRCALGEPELFRNHLEPGDFFDDRLRAIWHAGKELLAAGRPANLDTLADALEQAGILDGFLLLSDLIDGPYESPAHIDAYAETLHKWALKRDMLAQWAQLQRTPAGDNPPDAVAELDALTAQLGVLRAKYATSTRTGLKTSWTAAELLAATFPEPRWAVPGIIPVGLSMLAGRPKVGKSWLALQLAIAKGSGGYALGQHVEPGQALYLALEDSPRRLQERTTKQRMPATAGVTFATSWRRITDGGLDDLRRAITDSGYSLVIIDTLGRALGRVRHDDYGDMTAAVGELQELALLYDVAIIAIDHHRKSTTDQQYLDPVDEIQGSTAKSGSVDAAIGLFKEQGKRGAVLKVTGRDVEWQEYALSWDPLTCCWQLEGTAEEVSLRGRKGEVLEALRENYPEALTTKEIAELTGIGANHVSPILQDLVTLGYLTVEPKRGKQQPYALTEYARNNV